MKLIVYFFLTFFITSCLFSQEEKYNTIPQFPEFDISVTPFSYNGSWLVIQKRDEKESQRLLVKTLRHSAISFKWSEDWAGDYYEIALFHKDSEVIYNVKATPWLLELNSELGNAKICFLDAKTLYFKSEKLILKLIPIQKAAWIHPISGNELRVMPQTALLHQHFKTMEGEPFESDNSFFFEKKNNLELNPKGLTTISKTGSIFAFRETEIETFWNEPLPNFDQTVQLRKKEVESWMAKMPKVPSKYQNTANLAWFLLWNIQVNATGKITRHAIISAKTSWVTQKWGWDDCLQALPLAYVDLKLCFDQYMIFFDNQAENGSIADPLNDLKTSFAFKKPPMHGWSVKVLIQQFGWEACMPYLKEIYNPLSRWVDYWWIYCDLDKNGMPSYRHGNESGWDNATPYDQKCPIEGADLAAYLYVDAKILAEIAEKIGKPEDAKKWNEKANKQLKDLLANSVVNNRFVSKHERTNKFEPSQSLINYLPLIMGNNLPKNIVDTMLSDLSVGKGFLTCCGLASENTNSPKYTADGYWRGPIWGPPNYMIFNSLIELGKPELAKDLAQRYCDNMNLNPQFSENCDALTGKSYQVPGLGWPAAAYILMAHWLEKNK